MESLNPSHKAIHIGRSHKATAQTKTCQRVCLSQRTPRIRMHGIQQRVASIAELVRISAFLLIKPLCNLTIKCLEIGN